MIIKHPGGDLSRFSPGSSRRRRMAAQAGTPAAPAVAPALIPNEPRLLLCARTKLRLDGTQYVAGQPVTASDAMAAHLLAKGDVWRVQDSGVDWWKAEKRVLAVEPCDAQPRTLEPREGALRIAMGCAYDPGNAGYRMASAVNEHTDHAAAFIAWRQRGGNPFQCPEQYNAMEDKERARRLIYEADVLHSHAEFYLAGMSGLGVRPRPGQIVVKHYHGSLPSGQGTQHPLRNAIHDDTVAAIVVGARLTLCALRPGRMHWLPITIPVDRYAAMAAHREPSKVLRVAHSATKDEYKGTKDLVRIVEDLKRRHVPIELVLIGYRQAKRGLEVFRRSHAEALRLKAGCDVTLDSLHWLGLQGSGLEAGAMGQAALAGDEEVAQLYREHIGHVPYTHVRGSTADERRRSLAELLERMAVDVAFRQAEATRLGRYVREYHDYPAVARIYEDILARETGRDELRTVRADLPKLPPVEPMRVPPRRVA